MPQIEHNAPQFKYRVYYKRDIPGETWASLDVHDWRKNNLIVENQPTYQRYKIKVVSSNAKGDSKAAADEIIGHSGEDSNSLIKFFNFIIIIKKLIINASTL